jgi:hypothetical protein
MQFTGADVTSNAQSRSMVLAAYLLSPTSSFIERVATLCEWLQMAESEHLVLKPSHGLSTDIFPGVFDWFYTHDVFQRWRDTRTTWQLHCLGGPGAGKVSVIGLLKLCTYPKLD